MPIGHIKEITNKREDYESIKLCVCRCCRPTRGASSTSGRATNQILSVNMRAMIQFLSNPAYRTIWIIGGGIFLILSALPMLYNCVKPNPWYGFRVPKTLSDERIWYPANSYAAKGMILTGIITIVVAGVLRLTDVPPIKYQLLCVSMFLGGLILTLIMSLIYVRKLP